MSRLQNAADCPLLHDSDGLSPDRGIRRPCVAAESHTYREACRGVSGPAKYHCAKYPSTPKITIMIAAAAAGSISASLLLVPPCTLLGLWRQSSRGPLLCQLQIRKILNASQTWLAGRDLSRLQRLAAFVAVHWILQESPSRSLGLCLRLMLFAVARPVMGSLNHFAAEAVGCGVIIGARRLHSHAAVSFYDHGVIRNLAASKCFAGQADNWSAVVSLCRDHLSAPCLVFPAIRTLRFAWREYSCVSVCVQSRLEQNSKNYGRF